MRVSKNLVVGLLLAVTAGVFSSAVFGQMPTEKPKPKPGKIAIQIEDSLFQNAGLPVIVKKGEGELDNTLAMNVQHDCLPKIRATISKAINRPLDFFKEWNPEGEAHITVISPPEFFSALAGPNVREPLVSMDDIARIAESNKIQESDLSVLGVGSSMKKLDGKLESTFFLVLKSENLLKIRREISDLYLHRGGGPGAFNPELFAPHITIGFTKRDLHAADGVVKNMEHSEDRRFLIEAAPPSAVPAGTDEGNASDPAGEPTESEESAGTE
jgi:hypothetical protein